jgi:Gpi18-like mannosyltransferase
MSFYLSAIYPESLFLTLSIGAIYYARLQRWCLAGLLGGLASLTRPEGVLLTLAIGWEYWQFLAESYAPLQAGSRIVLLGLLRSRIAGLFHSLSA